MATTIAKAFADRLSVKQLEEIANRFATATSFCSPSFEERFSVPSEAYYFPLDGVAAGWFNGTRNINAIVQSPHFDSGSGWVGTASDNIWPLKEAPQGWSGGGTVTSNIAIFPLGSVRNVLSVTSVLNTLYTGNSFSITAGDMCTISMYYRSVDAVTPQQFTLKKTVGGSPVAMTNSTTMIPPSRDIWQRGWNTAQYTESITTAYPCIEVVATNKTVITAAVMAEKKPFVTPWCATSRAASKLQFNLHESIGLNWNESWTIVYWKRVHGNTTDGVATVGYNIDSLGCNSNTVGTGYTWWGKNSGSLAHGFSGTGTTVPWASMQYAWWMYSISYDGAGTMSLRVYEPNSRLGGVSGLVQSTTLTKSIPTDDYFVTQYGYDLMLGGYDDNTLCNNYYRDVAVFKSQLPAAEIDLLYNRRLRIFADHSEAAQLIEGVI